MKIGGATVRNVMIGRLIRLAKPVSSPGVVCSGYVLFPQYLFNQKNFAFSEPPYAVQLVGQVLGPDPHAPGDGPKYEKQIVLGRISEFVYQKKIKENPKGPSSDVLFDLFADCDRKDPVIPRKQD